MTARILLTGCSGQLGSALFHFLSPLGKVLAPGRQELDLANAASIRNFIRSSAPKLIVNAAAYTAVDRAETDRALAHAVNADAPAVMAEEAKRLGATLIHYSTDYVFDGTKGSPYEESDVPNPINVYGATKLAGEEAIRASGAQHLILRTAWVYGPRGRNFLLTILKLATERRELRIVSDQIGAPTSSYAIAYTTGFNLTIALNPATLDPPSHGARWGTYHMSAGGATSWYEFAVTILAEARRLERQPGWLREATGGGPFIVERVLPISTADYPTPARRPAYSVLSNAERERILGVPMEDWKVELRRVFERPERD